MGRRGPAKTPTNLVILRGNPRQKALPKDEPKPAAHKRVPSPPSHMSKIARNEWRRLVPELSRLGLLTKLDMRVLEGFCDAYGKFRCASEVLDRDGITYETITESGSVMVRKRPEWDVYVNSLSAMKQLGAEFGLTPSGRTRFGINTKPPKDREKESDDDFMGKRRRANP